MRARVVKIGNSQGIRIPKPLLEQTGITGDVELEVDVVKMLFYGVQRHKKLISEFFIAQPLLKQRHDLKFAFGQRLKLACVGRRLFDGYLGARI